jgi:hypothetical protein
MIKVNGVKIATPDVFNVSLEDIVKAERNCGGTIVIDRIATKRKLELSWTYLPSEDMTTLLSAVANVFFQVSYPDPLTGTERTATFYAGSKSSEGLMYKEGKMTWKGLKFNMIER